MPWFERPSAISASTSRSRSVSVSSGSSARRRPSSWRTIAGSSTEPPEADAPHGVGELVDVGDALLEQVADALGARRRAASCARPALDVLREHEHADRRDARRGSRAPPAGPRRSGSAACGCRRSPRRATPLRTLRSSSSAVALWPTTSKPASSSSRAMPSRSSTPSSATTTRTGSPRAPASRRPAGSTAQPAAERLDAVGEPAQAGAAPRVRAADAVVDDLDDERRRSRARRRRVAARRLRVLADVGQASRHESRRRPRPRSGSRPSTLDVEVDGHRRARGEPLERDREPVAGEHRRVDARGRARAARRATRRSRRARRSSRAAASGSLRRAAPRAARARARPRPAAAARRRGGCAPAAGARLSPASTIRAREPRSSSRRARSSACRRAFSSAIAGRGADRVEQLGLLVQRRVVHERGDVRAVAVDHRRRAVAGARAA